MQLSQKQMNDNEPEQRAADEVRGSSGILRRHWNTQIHRELKYMTAIVVWAVDVVTGLNGERVSSRLYI